MNGYLILGIIALIIGAGLLVSGRKNKARQALLERTATKKISQINPKPEELVCVEGAVSSLAALTSPGKNVPCVWYKYQVEKEYETGDSDSSSRTWKKERLEVRQADFFIDDGSQKLYVREADRLPLEGRLVSQEAAKEKRRFLSSFTGRVRIKEWVIPLQEKVFALGRVVLEGDRLCLKKPQQAPFILSVRSKEELKRQAEKKAVLGLFSGATLLLLSLALIIYAVVRSI